MIGCSFLEPLVKQCIDNAIINGMKNLVERRLLIEEKFR